MREDDSSVSVDGQSDDQSIGMQRMRSLLSLGLVLVSVPDPQSHVPVNVSSPLHVPVHVCGSCFVNKLRLADKDTFVLLHYLVSIVVVVAMVYYTYLNTIFRKE